MEFLPSIQADIVNPEFLIDALISINSAQCEIVFFSLDMCHENSSKHKTPNLCENKLAKTCKTIYKPFPSDFVPVYHL